MRILLYCSFCVLTLQVNAQQYNPNINAALNAIQNPVERVRQFESFGTKSAGSSQKQQTFTWIVDQYRQLGYDSIRVDSFVDGGHVVRNIIVTKTGIDSSYIVVCGHYDTRNGPGANDNGSGVAAIIETANVLRNLNTIRGIQFIHFDLEEDGFVGSDYHVNQVLGQSFDSNLHLVINIDQIGGSKGQVGNDKITCERDEDNAIQYNNARSWMATDTLARLATIYTSLTPEIDKAFLSDYIPFEKKGYVITGLYQNAQDVFGHSAADTVGNMDSTSFKQAVRLTAASVIHFAQVEKFIGISPKPRQVFNVYPNPTTNQLHFNFENNVRHILIFDAIGRELCRLPGATNKAVSIDVSHYQAGSYMAHVEFEDGAVSAQKILIAE